MDKSHAQSETDSSSAASLHKKAKWSLVAGVTFQSHRISGWENFGDTIRWVTLTVLGCGVSQSVTTVRGRVRLSRQLRIEWFFKKGFRSALRRRKKTEEKAGIIYTSPMHSIVWFSRKVEGFLGAI